MKNFFLFLPKKKINFLINPLSFIYSSTCYNSTYCLSCDLTGFLYLNTLTHTCVYSCPNGYYADSTTGNCEKCASGCDVVSIKNFFSFISFLLFNYFFLSNLVFFLLN